MKFISVRFISSNYTFASNSYIGILFPYLRAWLDHVPPNSFQAPCGGNFFQFHGQHVLKAHPPTHVNKNKELSNEWKQH